MIDLEEYMKGKDASASLLLEQFTDIKYVVVACENILLEISEQDPDARKWEAIRDALNVLLTLESQLSLCEGIANNVWSKVFRMEDELRHHPEVGGEQ